MKKLKILNQHGEKLDTWIEGKDDAQETVILVHGLGTNKHETLGFFDDIVRVLTPTFRTIRFDLSGYDQSEGKSRDACYSKHSQDLATIVAYARERYGEPISLLAQSMGCFVTLTLQPEGIRKTILTGIPNSNTNYIADRLQDRIRSKGGEVVEGGITIFPRTSGEIQELGHQFWSDLRQFNPISALTKYITKSDVLVIHPGQDDIVGNEYMQDYTQILGINWLVLDGDHSFTNPQDRYIFVQHVGDFLSS